MQKTLENRISLILLTLFISVKMMGLHVFTHDEDHEHPVHCNLCEQVVQGKDYNPALLAPTLQLQSTSSPVSGTINLLDYFAFSFCDDFIANPLFSRPPPAQV